MRKNGIQVDPRLNTVQECLHMRGQAVGCLRVQARAHFVDTIFSKWLGYRIVCRVILRTNLRKHVSVRFKRSFLDITNPDKRGLQTTGLEKGVLTATARVDGHWQMRGHVMRRILNTFFIHFALWDRLPCPILCRLLNFA